MSKRSRRRRPADRAGVDAQLVDVFFAESSEAVAASDPVADRKCRQVCREVFRVLAQATPGDPRLDGMMVLEVAPAPDASRLAVRVQLAAPVEGEVNVAAALAALARWRGELRGEIAQALQRKRTPELVFELAAPGGGAGPDDGEGDA